MDPFALLTAGRGAVGLAAAVGLLRDQTSRSLDALRVGVRELAKAPIAEGMRRLEEAPLAASDERRLALVDEARSRFADAAARRLDPLPHALALSLLAETWVLLDEPALAMSAAREAALAVEEAWSTYDEGVHGNQPRTMFDFRYYEPRDELKASQVLAEDVVALCLGLGVDLRRICPEYDEGDDWSYMAYIDEEFVEERRRRLASE